MTSEAKHVALSRPRLGFKSRPGRHLTLGRLYDLEKDQSLEGRTPAEAAEINLNDGWGDLIELATKYQVINKSDNGV